MDQQLIPSINQGMGLLRQFYPPDRLFLQKIVDFDPLAGSAIGLFNVPTWVVYSLKPLTYVTRENYVRCVSEFMYALWYMLSVHHDVVRDYITPEQFEREMMDGEVMYHYAETHFVKKIDKGQDFLLQMALTATDKANGGIRLVGQQFIEINLRVNGPIRETTSLIIRV